MQCGLVFFLLLMLLLLMIAFRQLELLLHPTKIRNGGFYGFLLVVFSFLQCFTVGLPSARVRRPDGRWVRADNAVVILCPMPDPPLMVMTLGGDYVSEDGAACAFELALADLNDAGRAANGFVEHDVGSSSSAPSSLSIVSRAIVAVIDAALRGLDYKCIKSLGTEARWGGGVTTRSV